MKSNKVVDRSTRVTGTEGEALNKAPVPVKKKKIDTSQYQYKY
jgi:hypothetical protein